MGVAADSICGSMCLGEGWVQPRGGVQTLRIDSLGGSRFLFYHKSDHALPTLLCVRCAWRNKLPILTRP